MNNPEAMRDGVRQAYTRIAERPLDEPLFPTGRVLAENLGYPVDLLDTLPNESVEAFCGVSNVSMFAEIPEGATVLDLGAGAGLDTLIAARRAGAGGKVVAIDFSDAMIACTRQAISEAQAGNVEVHLADAEQLPIEDASIDVAIINGIFNLTTDRSGIFQELARVVRPGGTVFAAELVLSSALTHEQRTDSTNWFS